MAQRDYILREIERLGEFLAALRRRLLGGAENGGVAQVRGDLEEFGQRAALNPTLLRSLTADTLALMIRDRAGADPATCWLWAEFLYIDGLTAQAEGDEDAARDRLMKARTLYGLLSTPHAAAWLEQVPERIAEIESLLE
jgi:hypothetical protein